MPAIFTGSNVMQELNKMNKTYAARKQITDMYSGVGAAQDIANADLDTQYSKQINDAYIASMSGKNNIAGENFAQGAKNAYEADIMGQLNDAFDKYVTSLQADKAKVAENAATSTNAITKMSDAVETSIQTEADNIAKYGNAHIDYVKALYDKAINDELKTNPFDDPTFSRYLNFAEDGSYELKNDTELQSMFMDQYGNLSDNGKDIILQLENDLSNTGVYSFGTYLEEKDKDLYDWATQNRSSFYEINEIDNDDTYNFFARENKLDEATARRYLDSLTGGESTKENLIEAMKVLEGRGVNIPKSWYDLNVTETMEKWILDLLQRKPYIL